MAESESEIQRLKRIIEAYEKLTSLSRTELLEADSIIEAQERVQALTREEIRALHHTIHELGVSEANLQEKIKEALSEDSSNEQQILEELERLRGHSGSDFYVDLFRVLVHYDFSAEEAAQHWAAILEHNREMALRLGRPVSFRAALLDYFISQNRILKNPKIIEISLFDEVLRSSHEDELTGLFNRRYLEKALPREVKRAQRHQSPLSVLILDIDDFKKYNDVYGHAAGDEVMRSVARILHENFRSEDIACRYGGEEFVVILPETDCKQALAVAGRFVECVRDTRFEFGAVTVSGGIAQLPLHGDSGGLLMLQADRALYRAKSEGKNSVLVAG
ncbi:MAG: GGDEF domain-containing protein [Leptospirales bacterium]|nr:GGDEF domain-containing protein [Leptospirales bacterium]